MIINKRMAHEYSLTLRIELKYYNKEISNRSKRFMNQRSKRWNVRGSDAIKELVSVTLS